MKKLKLSLIIVTLLGGIFVSAPALRAEDANTNAAPNAAGVQKKRPDRVQILDKAVALTDEQKTKAKAVYADQDKQLKALRETANGDRKAMMEGARKLNEETNKKIKELLTPDQQTKYAQFLEEMKQRGPKRPAATE